MANRSIDLKMEEQGEADLEINISSVYGETSEPPRKRRRNQKRRVVVSHIRQGARVLPNSAYAGTKEHERALNAKTEIEVLEQFLADELPPESDDGNYFTSYVLDEFVIYRNPDIKPVVKEAQELEKTAVKVMERGQKGQGEYELPSAVYIAHGVKNLVVDGILRSGDKSQSLYCIPFEILSIGNLACAEKHDVEHQIWIQSHKGARCNVPGGVWYELGLPAKEYENHWNAFRWLALFVKFVSDAFELRIMQRQEKVRLAYFRQDFANDIRHMHGSDQTFQRWINEFGKDDFRVAVATHVDFLWSQINASELSFKYLRQPLWGEVLPGDLTAIRPAHPPSLARGRCVVTAYVGSLFGWIFNEGLEVVESDQVDTSDEELDDLLVSNVVQPPKYYTFHHDEYRTVQYPRFTTGTRGMVRVGDVVELERDSDTRWKKSTQKWYAFVTDKWTTPKGVVKLKIIWLYWPEDMALCMLMKYPHANELFFSDHCECGKTILLDEVVRKVAVEFFCIDGKPKDPDAEYFVRQKYSTNNEDVHVTLLTPRDIAPETPCPCRHAIDIPKYTHGQFILVNEGERLQPYRFEFYEDKRAWVRKMERRREVDGGAGMVNELVWSEEVVDISPHRIARKCRVDVVRDGDQIQQLVASWKGSSDCFFYREQCSTMAIEGGKVGIRALVESGSDQSSTSEKTPDDTEKESNALFSSAETENPDSLTSISSSPSENRGSFDVVAKITPEAKVLRGLDLFCGGGNFGRGVADGGAVRHVCAVDIDTHALHTYKANLPQGEDKVHLYLGSVNNFLFDVITGCGGGNMPQRGDIELILAGSPCQGFSAANPQGHEAMKSLNNSALICTTISAIDFYRPKYAILENVPAMATDRKYRGNTVNISNQLMCALIGMGYQCRCLLLDAWNFGAPQLRTRLFIEIAAPGCILPSIPQGSHAHPLDIKGRAVGKTATNIKFAERSFDDLTAFPSVELKDFWGDLPKIGNSHLGVCIPFPDHKTYWTPNARDRQIMSRIPHSDAFASSTVWGRYPGYKYAFHKRKLMPEHLTPRFVPFEAQDGRFTRLSSDGLSPTITCVQAPQSRISGKTLHYDEDRALSNLEAKRVQGFFDSDVLIGKPHKAYRIIGNSVCRQVAYALGLSLKDALTRQTSQMTQMEQMEAEKASMQLEEKLSVDKGEPGLSALRKVKRTSNVELMVLIES